MTTPRLRRVLFSVPASDGNPYVHSLASELSKSAEVRKFTWANALFWSYDVFHIHWPEWLIRSATPFRRIVKTMLCYSLLARLKMKRIPVVRTVHNVVPHSKGTLTEEAFIRRLSRLVEVEIHLQSTTVTAAERPAQVIAPHPDYRDAVGERAAAPRRSGVLYFGRIEPYKGVIELLDAFQSSPADAPLRLQVLGQPSTPELRDALLTRVSANVDLDLRRVDDDSLYSAIEAARLVALPYKAMINSGAALLALTLGTPVLIPRSAATEALQNEFGDDWVHTFDRPLTYEKIAAAATLPIESVPRLEQRSIAQHAITTLAAYGAAHRPFVSCNE